MPYVSATYKTFLKTTVGDGECVALVKAAAGAPATSLWKKGKQARALDGIAEGTAIATFGPDGKYENVSGKSHAAIYVRQDEDALYVVDQWKGQTVHERPIRFKGADKPSNDGALFFVID